MKAKIGITRVIEVEIPDELEKYTWDGTWQAVSDEKIEADIVRVRDIVGLPFASDEGVGGDDEVFYGVYTMDGRAIFEA